MILLLHINALKMVKNEEDKRGYDLLFFQNVNFSYSSTLSHADAAAFQRSLQL